MINQKGLIPFQRISPKCLTTLALFLFYLFLLSFYLHFSVFSHSKLNVFSSLLFLYFLLFPEQLNLYVSLLFLIVFLNQNTNLSTYYILLNQPDPVPFQLHVSLIKKQEPERDYLLSDSHYKYFGVQ